MVLKGQKKKDYQRSYMRNRRAPLKLNSGLLDLSVRPLPFIVHPAIYKELEDKYPAMAKECEPAWELDADGNPIPED